MNATTSHLGGLGHRFFHDLLELGICSHKDAHHKGPKEHHAYRNQEPRAGILRRALSISHVATVEVALDLRRHHNGHNASN